MQANIGPQGQGHGARVQPETLSHARFARGRRGAEEKLEMEGVIFFAGMVERKDVNPRGAMRVGLMRRPLSHQAKKKTLCEFSSVNSAGSNEQSEWV